MVAWHLAKNGRPSMGVAIEAAMFKVMGMVKNQLSVLGANNMGLLTLKNIVEIAIKARIAAGRQSLDVLVRAFEHFIVDAKGYKKKDKGSATIIVTLSSSSTVTKYLRSLIYSSAANEMNIKLIALESRPMFEGVEFASALLDSLEEERSAGGTLSDFSRRL